MSFARSCPPFAEVLLGFMDEYTLHWRIFGVRQAQATFWMHVLLPVRRHTLWTLGNASCQQLETLREPARMTGPSIAWPKSFGSLGARASP